MSETFNTHEALLAEWKRSEEVLKAAIDDKMQFSIPMRPDFQTQEGYEKAKVEWFKTISAAGIDLNVPYLRYRLSLIAALVGGSVPDPDKADGTDDPFALTVRTRET